MTMEQLVIRFDLIDRVALIGGRQRKTAKKVWDSLGEKPDYLINAGMYDTKTGISVCDTVVDYEIINGGNYTNRGFSWETNNFFATNNCLNTRFFLGGGPSLVWKQKVDVDKKGLTDSYCNAITKRIGMGITTDSLVFCFPSAGCNINTLAKKMLAIGCRYAINLDGGGSTSVMDSNCKAINVRTEDRANSTWLAIYLKKSEMIDGHVVRVFSKRKDGTKKLSSNFKVSEFACSDGSDVIFIAPDLIDILQKVRDRFNASVTINSGYRTVEYNAKVDGSSSESQHCNGMAADIKVKGRTPQEVSSYIDSIMPFSGGIGVYKTFVHVDVRKDKARWNNV